MDRVDEFKLKRVDDRTERAHDDQLSNRKRGFGCGNTGAFFEVDNQTLVPQCFPRGCVADLKNCGGNFGKVPDSHTCGIGKTP